MDVKDERAPDAIKHHARIAGALYVLMCVVGIPGLLYVPGVLYVRLDATATADHIRASEYILRYGIATELIHQVINVFLCLALFRLFRAVDEMLSWQLVIMGALIPVPITCLNVVFEIAATIVVSGAAYLNAFSKDQLDALAMLFYRIHGQGWNVAQMFWGLWLFPFGLLVIRCEFIPKLLGYLLLIAGAGNLIDSLTTAVLPRFQEPVGQVMGILELGELPIIFWLVIWGATSRCGKREAAGI
jgi:hypothetical protein